MVNGVRRSFVNQTVKRLVGLLLLGSMVLDGRAQPTATTDRRANVVLLIADDQSTDKLG